MEKIFVSVKKNKVCNYLLTDVLKGEHISLISCPATSFFFFQNEILDESSSMF